MKIYKFGGASVRSAEAVKNLCKIVDTEKSEALVLVISAMGKTTNALEKIIEDRWNGLSQASSVDHFFAYHDEIVQELFPDTHSFIVEYKSLKKSFLAKVNAEKSDSFDKDYDAIVSFGEVFSTKIVSNYLEYCGIQNIWLDARKLIRTNENYREAKVNWDKSAELITSVTKEASIYVIQGFIGHTITGEVSTLGREGSDFSAAIMAWCINAESVTIWKDVPGMLNADPKYFAEAQKLDKISYREALELSYYGASVIHPKTIKPLRNKSIPLYIKSFLDLNEKGSVIQHSDEQDHKIPSFIFKTDQVLVSISTRDFSFVVEEHLEDIFGICNRHKTRINLMQNSAINFSICIDWNSQRFDALLEELKSRYRVLYNKDIELLTIRHYTEDTIDKLTLSKKVLVDQRSRVTARLVLEELKD